MKLKMSHIAYTTLPFFISLLLSLASHAQKMNSMFERLTPEEGVKLTLETDLTSLMANRKKDAYFPAMLKTAEGKSFAIEVKPRGKFRRKNCEVPPLKLKFPKKLLKAEGLDTFNEVKLVMPCIDNPDGDELVVREYLAYRMFEHLTGASVRARLVKLTLYDTHVESSRRVMTCMLVEHPEETAARLKGTEVETYGMPTDSLLANQAALTTMFQYMIGNTDWEIGMLRNVLLIRANTHNKVLVVPYDFDFSGLVSAPYASPSSESGLKTVRERFLMSNGLKPESLKRATHIIRSAKKEIFALCNSKYLSREARIDMTTFLETFFRKAEESEALPPMLKAPDMD